MRNFRKLKTTKADWTMAVLRRTCIGCGKASTKADLIRIVKSFGDGSIVVDLRGKEKGRGAYVCSNIDCINRAMEFQKLNRAFRIVPDSADSISLENIDKLRRYLLELMAIDSP